VAELLRAGGWNATYAGDVGLAGHDDIDVFAFAAREGRIILTHDLDFLDNRRFPPHRNPGVVVLPGASGEERELRKALGGMLSVVGIFSKAWVGAKIHIGAADEWTIRWWNKADGKHYVTRYRFPKKGMLQEWVDD
jgi:predicted nuclease of predicted toxin-antitoxin system